jgi:5-methyltetrahydropteroyltriglutamate--homocysteine methyltransferase
VGVVNQKQERVEPVAEIVERARVLLTPDCGFATFADNPVASTRVAEAKLRAIVEAAAELRRLTRT